MDDRAKLLIGLVVIGVGIGLVKTYARQQMREDRVAQRQAAVDREREAMPPVPMKPGESSFAEPPPKEETLPQRFGERRVFWLVLLLLLGAAGWVMRDVFRRR